MNLSDHLLAANKTNFDAWLRLTDICLSGAERLYKQQSNTVKEIYDEGARLLKSALEKRENGDSGGYLTGLYQASLQKSWNLANDFVKITTQTQSEFTQVLTEQLEQIRQEMLRDMEELGKAPLPTETSTTSRIRRAS